MTGNYPPLHIALYHPRALVGDGGITQSVRALAEGLEGAGYRVTVIYDGRPEVPSPPNWRALSHRGFRVLSFPTDLGAALDGVDVVVFHSAWVFYNVVAAKVANRMGIPYVLAPRGAYDPLIMLRRKRIKRLWWRLFERSVVDGAAAVHIFFELQKEHMESLGYEGAFIVAPNGVSVPSDRVWDGEADNRLTYVGRYDPEHKGLDILVEGLGLVPEALRPRVILRGPDWRGGEGRLRSLVARLGLEPWVEIGPPIYGDAKWQFICASAGFVYPSRWEAFGNSAAEAAALGVPTLVSDYPLGNFLHDHRAAVKADLDPRGMADALVRLLSAEARAVGERGSLVMREFTWDAISRAWGSQIERVVSTSRGPQSLSGRGHETSAG